MDIKIRALLFVLFCVITGAAFAHETATDPLSIGFTWLHDQHQSSGAFDSGNDSTRPLQSTYEAAIAFSNSDQLDHLDLVALSVFLSTANKTSTELLAKSIALNLRLNNTIDDIETLLLQRQNDDGGFGSEAGFDSTTYDTVFALQALALTRYRNTATSALAIGYLLKQQNTDGGFGLDSNHPSSAYLSSLALRALQPFLYSYNIGEAMTQARDYLFSLVASGVDWPSDWEAAQFLLAVIPLTTNTDLYSGTLNWLKIQQLTNGSWQNDVYATALALQALYLADNITLPTEPDAATVRGKIVDGSSGQPLLGVTIALAPDIGMAVTTDADGNFVLVGVQPNQYTFTYSSTGYLNAVQQVQTRAGQLVDVGTISLSVALTTALISGVVLDAVDGTPIENATVEAVNGPSTVQTVSGATGAYSLSVEAGTVALQVTAPGYQAIAASASISAGTSVKFSPSLYKTSDQAQPLEVVGRVLDQDTLQPLTNVAVTSVSGGTVIQTDSQGQFVFAGLAAGDQSFTFALTGYDGVSLSLVLPENGRVDIGTVQLKPVANVDTTSVQGYILDADTGLGVPNAAVAIDSFTTQSDANGFYRLSGIQSLDFVVGANATGYVFGSMPVNLAQPKALDINLTLQRANIAGISVDNVQTEKPNYSAYERVNFVATLTNETVRERYVRLYVLLKDEQGAVIDRFPATEVPAPSDPSDPETIAHYEEHLADALEVLAPNETRMIALEVGWNTGRQMPGNYHVVVQALEGSSSQLVSEKDATFSIEPTQHLSSIDLTAAPSFALMNSNPDIAIAATIHNGSNENTQVRIAFEVRTPSGAVLVQGEQTTMLTPEETTKAIPLTTLQHTFVESGNYPITAQVTEGVQPEAIVPGLIFVPPTVRLTVDQVLTPETVIPGASRKAQVQIQVKGVDGE